MTGIVSPIAIALLFAGLWPTDALAQGRRSKYSTELSTVDELHLQTGALGEQAERCGLVAGDLEAPARSVLDASRLRMIHTATNFVFVNVNVVAAGAVCAAAINVDLFRASNEFRASVSVWEHGSVIVGGKDGFNVRVREKIDSMTRDFLADWQKSRR
jgi:hypothetical protein